MAYSEREREFTSFTYASLACSRIVHAPGVEMNQGEMARPPIVRFNTRAVEDCVAKIENLVVPLGMLLPKSRVQ